jgi:hypothetical protein
MATDEKTLAAITLRTAQRNLETAELTHKKIVEQLSMRTATVAQIATTILTSPADTEYFKRITSHGKLTGAAAAVRLAEEIMAEAELSAAKTAELQASLG